MSNSISTEHAPRPRVLVIDDQLSSSRAAERSTPALVHARAPDAPSFAGPVLPMREMQRRYASWALDELGGRKMATAEKLGARRQDARALAHGEGVGTRMKGVVDRRASAPSGGMR